MRLNIVKVIHKPETNINKNKIQHPNCIKVHPSLLATPLKFVPFNFLRSLFKSQPRVYMFIPSFIFRFSFALEI